MSYYPVPSSTDSNTPNNGVDLELVDDHVVYKNLTNQLSSSSSSTTSTCECSSIATNDEITNSHREDYSESSDQYYYSYGNGLPHHQAGRYRRYYHHQYQPQQKRTMIVSTSTTSTDSSSAGTSFGLHKILVLATLVGVTMGLIGSCSDLADASSSIKNLFVPHCVNCQVRRSPAQAHEIGDIGKFSTTGPRTGPSTGSTSGSTGTGTGSSIVNSLFGSSSSAHSRNADANDLQEKSYPSWYTEAVILTIDFVEECDAIRLYHLVETSKTKYREVWVLHNHHLYQPTSPEIKRSNELLMSIPGLKFASQLGFAPGFEIEYFEGDNDARPRRTPITSALNFVVVNNYTQGWYMEPDVFYTGDWNEIFDADVLNPLQQDIDWVASQRRFRASNDDWWTKRKASKTCKIQHRSCVSYETTSFPWPLARVSNKLASMLLHDLQHGVVQGHHEVIIGAYIKFRDLKHRMVPQDKLGIVVGGGWDKWERPIDLTVDNMAPQPSKLYHPVDCIAYQPDNDNTMNEVDKWSNTTMVMKQDQRFMETLGEGKAKNSIRPVPEEKAVRKFTGERTVLPPVSTSETNGREALFWTTMLVDECEAIRLRHLVETSAAPNRDIWVLHTHSKYPDQDAAELRRSKELIASIPGLRSADQAKDRIIPFDSAVSGTGKSSVLKMIVQEKYDFGWHIENDAFFTGAWRDIFDYAWENSKDQDAISLLTTWRPAWSDWWRHDSFKSCYVGRKACSKFSGVGFGWPFARFSHRFAYALITEMEEGYVQGHHEPIVPAYARFRGFSYTEFPADQMGDVDLGNWGTLLTKHKTLDGFQPEKNKLYHPLKCKAYGTDLDQLKHDVMTWGSPASPKETGTAKTQ